MLRIAFGVSLVSALAAIGYALTAVLTPPALPAEVAVGRVDDVVADTPIHVRLAQLDQLPALARHLRGASPAGTGAGDPHGIYLVRDEGGAVRAFLAADPRSGCGLQWRQLETASGPVGPVYQPRFYDTCHGALYDRNGTVVGGPSPWTLDEAVIAVRGGIVYARTADVRAGQWIAGERSTIVPGCDLRANVRSVGDDGRISILGLRAGAQAFIGQVYRGPFMLRVPADVRVDGHTGADLGAVVSVGDTVCLSFTTQRSPIEPVAFPGSNWVLSSVSVLK